MTLLLGLLLAVRLGLIRRELRRRVGWRVRPARELDPSKEDVAQFARQLGRARGAVQGRLLRPSAAVRVRLRSVGDGGLQYEMDAPRIGALVVERAMYRRAELERLGGVVAGGDVVPDVELLVRPMSPVEGGDEGWDEG
jgi:hypothetical protein